MAATLTWRGCTGTGSLIDMKLVLWAVYRATIRGKPHEVNVVCDQSEWDALELAQPGVYTLIRGGITSEGEAERLARGVSGDPVKRRA
jgi:hypothetical protein